MYSKILTAVDGSEPSMKAFDEAVDLSLELSSELTVISVIDELEFPFSAQYGFWAKESHEELLRRVLESLNHAVSEIKNNHPLLKIDARIEEGRPAEVIVNLAEQEDFNLIVLGRQGYGMVKKWVLGSVSNELMKTSTKPVLVL